MPIRKIDMNLGTVPSWGDNDFDENVHKNFVDLKNIIPKINDTVTDMDTAVNTVNQISQNVYNQPVNGGYSQAYMDTHFLKWNELVQGAISEYSSYKFGFKDYTNYKPNHTTYLQMGTNWYGDNSYFSLILQNIPILHVNSISRNLLVNTDVDNGLDALQVKGMVKADSYKTNICPASNDANTASLGVSWIDTAISSNYPDSPNTRGYVFTEYITDTDKKQTYYSAVTGDIYVRFTISGAFTAWKKITN